MAKRENKREVVEKATSPKKKAQFSLLKNDSTHTALAGLGFIKFGGGDWISPSGKLYRDISNSQEDLEKLYNYGPEAKAWVKAPSEFKATWEKL